jgi:signal transduction histidine kinase/ActR/RegA family two-component response regulator
MDRTFRRSPLARYGLALLLVAVALLLRWLLWPLLGPEVPFLFLWPAVMIAAWYGGLGPGLLVTALSLLSEEALLLRPDWHQTLGREELAGMALFGLLGVLLSVLADRLRRARRQAERRAEELAEAHRRKDEFLAMLGHELRNPLAPIKNAACLLRLRRTADEQAGWAGRVIERQVDQLARLVDDLLDVSRISQGKIILRRQQVELAEVVERAVESSRPLIEDRRHELVESLPPGPVWLEADPVRLAQVIANLLNNAAKYTEDSGRITLSAITEAGELVLRVRDTGIGIAPEMMPHIFEMFTQEDRSLDRSQGGLGLGLTLVRQLVEMHGGNVEASSEGAGQGSEFVVRLPVIAPPLRQLPQQLQGEEETAAAGKLRILVVDDNRDAAEGLSLLLQARGHEVRIAHDGLAGLEEATVFRPDVALLDIGMPKLSGCELARGIRGQAWGRDTVLIALTGWGQEDDRRRSAQAGFDHHVVKPADPDTLQELFSRPTPPGICYGSDKGQTPGPAEGAHARIRRCGKADAVTGAG